MEGGPVPSNGGAAGSYTVEAGDTAYAILRVMLRRLERDGKISLAHPATDLHQRWLIDEDSLRLVSKWIPEPERPPIRAAD